MLKATRYDSATSKGYADSALLTGARTDVNGKMYIDSDATGGAFRIDAGTGKGHLKFDVIEHKPSASYAIGGVDVPIIMAATAQYGISTRIQKRIGINRRADYSLSAVVSNQVRGTKRISDGSFIFYLENNAAYSLGAQNTRLINLNRSASLQILAEDRRLIALASSASYGMLATDVRTINKFLTAQFFMGTIALAKVPRTLAQESVDIGAILSGIKGDVNVRFRLFVSDKYGNEGKQIREVESASVSMSNFRDNTWELSLSMIASDVFNPYTDYVMPAMDLLVRTSSGREYWERFPLGLYRFDVSGPSATHASHLSRWSLTGQSPEILLLGDTAENGYTVPSGTFILAQVKQILVEKGVPASMIDFPAKDKALTSTMYFDVSKDAGSVFWLRICNALLSAGGFLALYTDAYGYFKTALIRDSSAREAGLNYGVGGDQLVVGEVSDDFTESDFANRIVARSNDVNQVPPLVAVAVNRDSNSPASVKELDRIITREVSVQSVVSQAELMAIAQEELSRASGRYHKLAITSVPDPRIVPRRIMNLELYNAKGKEIASGSWRVISQTLPLNGDRMSHELARSERWQ